jgi:hypothetical protein
MPIFSWIVEEKAGWLSGCFISDRSKPWKSTPWFFQGLEKAMTKKPENNLTFLCTDLNVFR